MSPIIVTRHAAQRWAERVTPCTEAEAESAILSHSAAIHAAAAFGATALKLPSTHRLVLDGATVITVLPKGRFKMGGHHE